MLVYESAAPDAGNGAFEVQPRSDKEAREGSSMCQVGSAIRSMARAGKRGVQLPAHASPGRLQPSKPHRPSPKDLN